MIAVVNVTRLPGQKMFCARCQNGSTKKVGTGKTFEEAVANFIVVRKASKSGEKARD